MKNTMKKLTFLISFAVMLLFVSTTANSGSFPDNLVISSDGTQMQLFGQNKEGVYDITQLKTFYLRFDQSDWWTQLTNNYKSETEIPATLIYEGDTLYNVGVRFRGNTSYQMTGNSKKKSFKISTDYSNDEQKLMGYKSFNLNNAMEDPSMMREVLYHNLAQQNSPCAKSNFAILNINGENWGVYNNSQQLNKDFLEEWYLSNDGSNWRCEIPDSLASTGGGGQGGGQGGGFGAGYCSLNYLGASVSSYYKYYTLKSTDKENPWTDLQTCTNKLNNLSSTNYFDSVIKYIDIDQACWFLANEILFTDDDSYVNKGGMDYYVYWDAESGRLHPIEYDGNSTFSTKNVSWSPFLKESDTKYPLCSKLFGCAEIKHRYAAHVRTMLNTVLDETYVNSVIEQYRALIETAIFADSKKLYTNAQFTSSITELKNFIKNRRANLLKNAIIAASGPTISDVKYFSAQGVQQSPKSNETVKIQAAVACTSGVNKVMLYYGTGLMGVFSRVQMYDDGNHNDGTAGDGIFGGEIPAQSVGTYVRFYVEGIANDAYLSATYSPEGAEHNVYFYQVAAEVAANSDVVINEIMPSNKATITDPQGKYEDWVELFNKGSQDIDLSGMYMSDKIAEPKKWQFPENTVIKAGEYLIIWADEDIEDEGLHADFKLSADGESVILMDKDANSNVILDSISFGIQENDISYGRYVNGTGNFTTMLPTPGAINDKPLSVENNEFADNISISNIYPNPFKDFVQFNIETGIAGQCQVDIYDCMGIKVETIERTFLSAGNYSFKWNGLNEIGQKQANGTYFIQIKFGNSIISKPCILLK